MMKIKKEFIRSGFHHKLVQRDGDVAIYQRGLVNRKDVHYEVVKISRHGGYKMGGAFIKAAETYPGASLWGIQGWTCNTMERAQETYKTACERFNKVPV